MKTFARMLLPALVLGLQVSVDAQRTASPSAPPKTPRLYVFDCGVINVNRAGTERYKVTPEEVGETRFSVPCFLVAHPKGTLMWDLGILPDDTDITYFAFSHAHVDLNANANLFAASTWLARPAERAFMWEEGNTRVNRTFFENIKIE